MTKWLNSEAVHVHNAICLDREFIYYKPRSVLALIAVQRPGIIAYLSMTVCNEGDHHSVTVHSH